MEMSIPQYPFVKGKRSSKGFLKGKEYFSMTLLFVFMKNKYRTGLFIVFVKKDMSKYYLLSVSIAKVAVVAI